MWSKLLAPLRIEPTTEADFESRFLEDFHRRLKQEPVRVPLMSQLAERVKFFMADFAGRKWTMAATTVLAMAFVLIALLWPQPDVPKAVASVGSPVEQVAAQKKRTVSVPARPLSDSSGRVLVPQIIVPIHLAEEAKEEQQPSIEITPAPTAE